LPLEKNCVLVVRNKIAKVYAIQLFKQQNPYTKKWRTEYYNFSSYLTPSEEGTH